MSTKKRKRDKRPSSLSQGRPPTLRKPAASLSAKATRTLIRSHHQLQKAHAKAVRDGDAATAASIAEQIDQKGGLKSYQQASITGQSSERGGDSSKVLMQWLDSALKVETTGNGTRSEAEYKMLEVGALSPSNACSRSPLFSVTRIDLHSQHPSIQKQDFMERPLPTSDEERFDVISLSLVVNYVPDAAGRGDMLRRTCQFLKASVEDTGSAAVFPSLFLVLPAACVTNSRYLDEERLGDITNSLGYVLLQRKVSTKLVYYLWKYNGPAEAQKRAFPKVEVRSGKARNNFCIVLR
ncbi:25S rRNA (adenine2142-N1)-methyltransferase [Coniosporium apollinis]|uniref:25S rRNA adenine-N(1) methyltransferase n=1 Tax=Coniosporium apollinis TaxID=61459 RepID=A0ABQ9NNQ6_9PEZI|nr:25S rRNA (adenine2142-N1)-methyltransferase [Coniosporium apollinis]